MSTARMVVIAALVFVLGVACGNGAGPRDAAPYVTPAVKAGCLLIRAIARDGRVDEVCATAEDLAPLIGELLAQHERNVRDDPTLEAAKPIVAFSIAPTKRPAPKRRCAQWVVVQSGDGGIGEAGTEAGRPELRDGGDERGP